MAKIAVPVEQPGRITRRALARGDGWIVDDVVCSSGPDDRPFEEQHAGVTVAMVVSGTFQYRSSGGRDLMTPGSLLLGSAGQCFECGHEHATGDRCIAFRYAPDYFERVAADAGATCDARDLRLSRLPPLRNVSPLVALACAGLARAGDISWEELAVRVAARVAGLSGSARPRPPAHRREPQPGAGAVTAAQARVTPVVRMIDRDPAASLSLGRLARDAGLSPYHFLRTFWRATGITPHQYIVRARLRRAALRLVAERSKVIDIALESGFGDVSNFNRTFRTEFGVSPRAYRRVARTRQSTER